MFDGRAAFSRLLGAGGIASAPAINSSTLPADATENARRTCSYDLNNHLPSFGTESCSARRTTNELLTLIVGVLREPLWRFILIVTLAKGGRYLALELIATRLDAA